MKAVNSCAIAHLPDEDPNQPEASGYEAHEDVKEKAE
jgi:hypothetical protein